MILLLPLSFLMIFLTCLRYGQDRSITIRSTFLASSIIWSLFLVLFTEILSIFRMFTLPAVSVCWGILIFVLTYLLVKQKFDLKSLISVNKVPLSDRLFLGGIIFIISVLAIIAYFAPPQNFDSMTYHLARVAHWAQNATVSHYFTSIQRQLYYNPFSEFIMLHFYVLFGESDRFLNFVQWFSLCGSLMALSVIARCLGSSAKGQIVTAIIALTVPMGILQASSTQNDHVVAYLAITSISFFLLWRKREMGETIFFLLGSFALALALLTKATAYIYCFPFMLWFLGEALIKLRARSIKYFCILIVCIAAINGPHWARNLQYFHKIMPSSEEVVNQRMDLKAFASNIIRNASLHFTPFNEDQRAAAERGMIALHQKMGVDISDPKTSFAEFSIYKNFYGEDSVGNMLHFIMIILSLFVLILVGKKRFGHDAVYLTACSAVSFLLFCLILKWQPWHSRLHLFYFLIFAPVIVHAIERMNRQWLLNIAGVIFLISAIPPVFFTPAKQVLSSSNNIFSTPRADLYFANTPKREQYYQKAAEYIQQEKCGQVGLILGHSDQEYPFWFLTRGRSVRIEHVRPDSEQDHPLGKFSPCIIIASAQTSSEFVFEGRPFVKTEVFPDFSIYREDPTGLVKRKNQLVHFDRLVTKLKKIPLPKEQMDAEHATQIILYRDDMLRDAQCLDLDELNKIYPPLGVIVEKTLLMGLRIQLRSYVEQNGQRFQTGNQLIAKWNEWFSEHSEAIKDQFVLYLSQTK